MSNKIIACITDSHFGARGDSPAILAKQKVFYDEVFFPTLKKRGVTDIIHLGDFFDKGRAVNFQTLQKVREMFISPCIQNGYYLAILVGNHDAYFKNSNLINSSWEITAILKSDGAAENWAVYQKPDTITIMGEKIDLLPYVHASEKEAAAQFLSEKSGAKILMGHLDIIGFEMQKGFLNTTHGFDIDQFKRYKRVYTGHYHIKSEKGNIYYLGAPYELKWSDYGQPRGFHLLDLDTLELEYIENPHKVFVVFDYDDTGKSKLQQLATVDQIKGFAGQYLKIVAKKVEDKALFTKFLKAVDLVRPENYTVFQPSEVVEHEVFIPTEGDSTMSIIEKYVRSRDLGETDITHDEVLEAMKEVYLEAERQ